MGATLGSLRCEGTSTSPSLGSTPSLMQHEVLQICFKNLLNPKDRAQALEPWWFLGATTAPTGKLAATVPGTSGGSICGGGMSESGGLQTGPDSG